MSVLKDLYEGRGYVIDMQEMQKGMGDKKEAIVLYLYRAIDDGSYFIRKDVLHKTGHFYQCEVLKKGMDSREAQELMFDKIADYVQSGFDRLAKKSYRRYDEEVVNFYRSQFIHKRVQVTKVHRHCLFEHLKEIGEIYSVNQDYKGDILFSTKFDNGELADLRLGKDEFKPIS